MREKLFYQADGFWIGGLSAKACVSRNFFCCGRRFAETGCSRNGTLLGRRDGDRFFTFDGEVLQADNNASTNILHRLTDTEIGRYQKAETVQKILLRRTASFLASMGLTLDFRFTHA